MAVDVDRLLKRVGKVVDGAVLNHYAFGLASGAGGVDDVGQVLRTYLRAGICCFSLANEGSIGVEGDELGRRWAEVTKMRWLCDENI